MIFFGKGDAAIWARSAGAGSQCFPLRWSGGSIEFVLNGLDAKTTVLDGSCDMLEPTFEKNACWINYDGTEPHQVIFHLD